MGTNRFRNLTVTISGAVFVIVSLVAILPSSADAECAVIERSSVAADGTEGNAQSGQGGPSAAGGADVSTHGRFVAFASAATNLVPGDLNGHQDVFVRDRVKGTVEIVSLATDGNQALGSSGGCRITPNGHFVAFGSVAENLVATDANGLPDIFVRDLTTGVTELISVATDGTAGGATGGVAAGAGDISDDGRYVLFRSRSTSLVPGGTSGDFHVFLRDRQAGVMELISVATDGSQGLGKNTNPQMTGDARYVVFESSANNLAPGDTNGVPDIFVRDRETGTTERVSVASDGSQANGWSTNPDISSDGRYVVFESQASNLVPGDTNGAFDAFIRDRLLGTTERLSVATGGGQGNNGSFAPTISRNGRFVAFQSEASNLVAGDTNGTRDMFVRDLIKEETALLSARADGVVGNARSLYGRISPNGLFVVFLSDATNLVGDDTNGVMDVFLAENCLLIRGRTQ